MRSLRLLCLAITPALLLPAWAQAQAAGYEVLWSERDMPGHDYLAAWEKTTYCPAGKVAIGGGLATTAPGSIVGSHPRESDIGESGWRVEYLLDPTSSASTTLRVYVVCVNAEQGSTSTLVDTIGDLHGVITGEVTSPKYALMDGGSLTSDTFVKPGFGDPNGRAYRYVHVRNLTHPSLPAVAKDVILGYAAIHDPAFLTDLRYGNGSSWIGTTNYTWVKIDLGSVESFNRLRFGRDRTGAFDDRPSGGFSISVATSDTYANGDDSGDVSEYTVVANSATMGFDGTIPKGQSVEVAFPTVSARYVKITFARAGVAIDEVEVYLRN